MPANYGAAVNPYAAYGMVAGGIQGMQGLPAGTVLNVIPVTYLPGGYAAVPAGVGLGGFGQAGMQMAVQMPAAAPLNVNVDAKEVDEFILANRLDAAAAQSLKGEPGHVQRAVMDRGSLAECSNPSSAVIGRIRDAKLDAKYGRVRGPGGMVVAGGLPAGAVAVSPAMLAGGACGSRFGAAEAGGPGATPQEVEAFIVENRLDDGASNNLRKESPQVQAVVIARGSLAECLNPSSAVIGRIRDAKQQTKFPGAMLGGGIQQVAFAGAMGASGGGGGGDSVALDQFITENHLDEGAAKALRDCPADVSEAVIARGSLMECTNPSSAVMGRIREAKKNRIMAAGAMAMPGIYGAAGLPAGLLRASPY